MKNKWFNQRFELLTIYKEFNIDIAEFRRQWNIDVQACEEHQMSLENCLSARGYKTLHDDFLSYEGKIIADYRDSDYFQDKVRNIRKQNTLLSKKKSYNERTNEPTALEEYNEAIKSLLDKRNLSGRYEGALKLYIYRNKVSTIPSVIVSESFDDSSSMTNPRRLELSIFPEITAKDFEEIWPIIVEWKKETQKVNDKKTNKPIVGYELVKKIWILCNGDKELSSKQIAAEINKNRSKVIGLSDVAITKGRILKWIKGERV